MSAIQKTIIVLLCGLLGLSMCRAKPEPMNSIVTVRFGETEPTAASPQENLSTEAATTATKDTPQGDGTGDLSQEKTSEYPELDGSPQYTQPADEPPPPAQPPAMAPARTVGRWVTVRQPVYGRFGRFRGYKTVRQWR